jgi:hypothetical protein
MKRQANKRGSSKFRKNSALKPECIKWLKENPVTDAADVMFLKQEEGKLYSTLLKLKEESATHEKDKMQNLNWIGPNPWLQLYCCMVHD